MSDIPLGEHSPITLAIRAITLLKTYATDLRNHPADVRVVELAEQALAFADAGTDVDPGGS